MLFINGGAGLANARVTSGTSARVPRSARVKRQCASDTDDARGGVFKLCVNCILF